MFNVHIDVRGPYPVLYHGMRSFKLEHIDRGVTIEQAVTILYDRNELEADDPLVQMVEGWRKARNI